MGSAEGLQGPTEVTPRVLLFRFGQRQRRVALDGQNALRSIKNLENNKATINYWRVTWGSNRKGDPKHINRKK